MIYRITCFCLVTTMLCQCVLKNSCRVPLINTVDSLIRTSGLGEEYKSAYMPAERELLSTLCSKISDKEKIILIEVPETFTGLMYIFDNDKVYTYENNYNEIIKYSDGFKYDSSGWFKRFFLSIKDSTLEKLEIHNLQKRTGLDRASVFVFYLDNEEKVFKFFNLH